MTDVETRINEHLEQENRRLEQTLELVRAAGSTDPEVKRLLSTIVQHLPQLGQQATNLSFIASRTDDIKTAIKDESTKTRNMLGQLVDAAERQASASERQANSMETIARALDRVADASEEVSDEQWKARLRETGREATP